jgi:hypothetical protein
LFGGASCYSKVVRAKILPETFVLLENYRSVPTSGNRFAVESGVHWNHTSRNIKAKIVAVVSDGQLLTSVSVTIFGRY